MQGREKDLLRRLIKTGKTIADKEREALEIDRANNPPPVTPPTRREK